MHALYIQCHVEIQPRRDQRTCRPRLTENLDDYSSPLGVSIGLNPTLCLLNNTLVDTDRQLREYLSTCTCADPRAAEWRLSPSHCMYHISLVVRGRSAIISRVGSEPSLVLWVKIWGGSNTYIYVYIYRGYSWRVEDPLHRKYIYIIWFYYRDKIYLKWAGGGAYIYIYIYRGRESTQSSQTSIRYPFHSSLVLYSSCLFPNHIMSTARLLLGIFFSHPTLEK